MPKSGKPLKLVKITAWEEIDTLDAYDMGATTTWECDKCKECADLTIFIRLPIEMEQTLDSKVAVFDVMRYFCRDCFNTFLHEIEFTGTVDRMDD